MEIKSKRILAGMMAGFSVLSTQSVLGSFQKLPINGSCNLISYADPGDSTSAGTGSPDIALYVVKSNARGDLKGKLIYKINFAGKRSDFAINTILRNSGLTKEVTDKNGQKIKTAITALDLNNATSADNTLEIEDTANFFKAKADGGNNLIEFKLTAKYTDSNGASQSAELSLNTQEYITQNGEGYQAGNTYQIINTSDSCSTLYWGTNDDADKLIFEIPIELPEQVKVESTDYNIELFEVSVPYSNEAFRQTSQTPTTEESTKASKSIL